MALLLTTAIILSVSVQKASAAPQISTENFFNRVKDFQQTILEFTNVNENQFLKTIINTLAGSKLKELEDRTSSENDIVFVIEEVPLDIVLGTKTQKVQDVGQSPSSRGKGPDFLREDVELLARIIHAEARGESFEGQVAVGAVVLNRVQHPDFPKSIKEVVYQPGQFTAVEDRQIELDPNNTAFEAAQAALEGQDPSNGAIYYYNPKISTDSWIRTRSVLRSIGNHKFCV